MRAMNAAQRFVAPHHACCLNMNDQYSLRQIQFSDVFTNVRTGRCQRLLGIVEICSVPFSLGATFDLNMMPALINSDQCCA